MIPNVYYLIPVLAVFELAVGVLILGRHYRRVGIAVATVFTLTLTLFGWGFFLWSGPVLALLGRFTVRELRAPAHPVTGFV